MKSVLLGLAVFATAGVLAQNKDKAEFRDKKDGYYQTDILTGIEKYESSKADKAVSREFKIDVAGKDYPTDPKEYTTIWKNDVISQGNTGTCWCFSTTSFYESEVKRITGKEVKLSQMYTVYWEYVERARYFVAHRGDMTLGEGSETNAVARMMKMYGVVPLEAYTGKKQGQVFHNHEVMFDEIHAYLNGVKERNAWDENTVVTTVKSILEHYMGAIPTKVTVDGKEMTPIEYMNSIQIKPDDYINFMSLKELPYWSKGEYDVPDNWWNSKDYNNVPLDDFMSLVKGAVKAGYGISIGGDVSEVGFDKQSQIAIVPDFDIPSEYINENSRQMRFLDGSTTDDHAMHLVGYLEKDGSTWFLIKDSGSGSRNCGEECEKFGYYFMHEDYVKLKMMSITLHRDAALKVLKKMK